MCFMPKGLNILQPFLIYVAKIICEKNCWFRMNLYMLLTYSTHVSQ